MKELRVKCKECGERFSVIRVDRERISAYCALCREDREREQARVRVEKMRRQRGMEPRQVGLDGELYPHQNPV